MSPLDGNDSPHLILGCGYLGLRVAARWLASGRRVVALTRRRAEALRATGIEPLTGDVLDRASLRGLPAATTVLYAIGFDRTTGNSIRQASVTGLANVLDTLPPCERFIFISSTGVYNQSAGEWVNETSPTAPVEESGRAALEAERLLRARRPGAVILRFAGLYGPDRLFRARPIRAGEPLVGDAPKWLNLVHVSDGADAILCAESRGSPGETYNVADGAPVSRREIYTLLAELFGAPPAAFDQRSEPGTPNRRIDSTKARTFLGWAPAYPSYRKGLTAAVAESTMYLP
jgi:nucleoside-diphosphate-sugar epimerase